MSTAPTLRLHLFHARDTTKSVILRQGPSKTYRMILWNRDGDTFQDGQWLKQKIYERSGVLSPDGKHFMYFTLDGQWGTPTKGSYTVICKPPFFTALKLFPEGDNFGGGGIFIDAGRFCVQSHRSTPDIIGDGRSLERVFAVPATHSNPFGLVDAKDRPLRLDAITRDWLAAGRPDPASVAEYETEGPCLYRRRTGSRDLIRDFSDMAFEPVRAPYAPPRTWHPLREERP